MTVGLGEAKTSNGMRVYAIGDVHGCHRQMLTLLDLIDEDLRNNPPARHRIIMVGDYVDRGPDSRQVVDHLIGLQRSSAPLTCLKGNHEEKFLNFLAEPMGEGAASFFAYGGGETLASYGFDVSPGRHPSTDALARIAGQAETLFPPEHQEFLSNLPLTAVEGDYFFCHAGVRPNVPLDRQSGRDLVWIREPFLSHRDPLEKVIVHGHTPCEEAEFLPVRINIDTGCVFGRKLTAVVLEGTAYRLLDAGALLR